MEKPRAATVLLAYSMFIALSIQPSSANQTVSFETEGDHKAVVQPSPAGQLQEQLEAQGWEAVEGKDGSRLYYPPGHHAASSAAAEETESTPAPPLSERLSAQLEAQGWEAADAEDGSRYYFPPKPAPSTTESQQASTVADTLAAQLEAQGWRSVEAADGSLIYFAPGTQDRSPPSASIEAPSLAEHLRSQLESKGWKAVDAEDGGMFYLPPGHLEPSSEDATVSAPSTTAAPAASPTPRVVERTAAPKEATAKTSAVVPSEPESLTAAEAPLAPAPGADPETAIADPESVPIVSPPEPLTATSDDLPDPTAQAAREVDDGGAVARQADNEQAKIVDAPTASEKTAAETPAVAPPVQPQEPEARQSLAISDQSAAGAVGVPRPYRGNPQQRLMRTPPAHRPVPYGLPPPYRGFPQQRLRPVPPALGNR